MTLFIISLVKSECRIQEFLSICQPDQNNVPHFGFNLPKDLRTNLIKSKIILLKPILDRRTSSNRHVLLLVNICAVTGEAGLRIIHSKLIDTVHHLCHRFSYARVPRKILGCEILDI